MLYSSYMKKYFYHKIENLLLVNKIVTLHRFSFDKSFCSVGESHNFWEIVFAERESLVCTADGREIILEEGEVLFHKPNEHHVLKANGKKNPEVRVVSFECKSEAMRFFEEKKLRPDERCLRLFYSVFEEGEKTFDIAESDPDRQKMELLSSPTLGGEQLIKNYLELFLINLMRSLTETEQGNPVFLEKSELQSRLVSNILRMMDENLSGALCVEDIAKQTNYSRAYIFREFKRATGKSIIAYYNERRIRRAAELLCTSSLSVKEIAERFGFDTPNYFSKSFKRIMGATPSVYKRSRAADRSADAQRKAERAQKSARRPLGA